VGASSPEILMLRCSSQMATRTSLPEDTSWGCGLEGALAASPRMASNASSDTAADIRVESKNPRGSLRERGHPYLAGPPPSFRWKISLSAPKRQPSRTKKLSEFSKEGKGNYRTMWGAKNEIRDKIKNETRLRRLSSNLLLDAVYMVGILARAVRGLTPGSDVSSPSYLDTGAT
jgi:hypothetical protein